MYKFSAPLFASLALLNPCTSLLASTEPVTYVYKANEAMTIDGQLTETVWQNTPWLPIDKPIIGGMPDANDFQGRYKLSWDQQYLYLAAEIKDNILFDQHRDPTYMYWDDDCLEIFVDEDNSGGDHQFNFNAFAYHIGLDNQVADIGPNLADGSTNFILLNDHIKSAWKAQHGQENTLHWEVAIAIYDDTFALNKADNKPVTLTADKTLGFMLAYCDNDGSQYREHFIGNLDIKPLNGDKNLGYKDASVFAPIRLKNNRR
ncbi:sugar-binding protein [Thalassotalea aquiviva]|uniref:sugar-binding protein n=1 Tax=Thalassotalea aquiviva TaxID=3242415 RepID=UPI00352BCC70